MTLVIIIRKYHVEADTDVVFMHLANIKYTGGNCLNLESGYAETRLQLLLIQSVPRDLVLKK